MFKLSGVGLMAADLCDLNARPDNLADCTALSGLAACLSTMQQVAASAHPTAAAYDQH